MVKKLIIFLIGICILLNLLTWVRHHVLATDLFSGLIGALINGFLTLILIYVAWKELDSISNTSKADFLIKMKHDFFTKEARKIIHLIENGYIDFIDKERLNESFFKVNENKIKESALDEQIKQELTEHLVFSIHEMGYLVLGHFEDIGIIEQGGSLSIEMVYEEFSRFLKFTWDNPEIQKYIRKQRQRKGAEDIYDKFEYIKNKCDSFEKAKLSKKSIPLWKIRYWIYAKLDLLKLCKKCP